MAKLNKGTVRAAGSSLLRTKATVPDAVTHQGGAGYTRENRTQLFLLTTTTFAGEGSYYEDAAASDNRMKALTRETACENGGWKWLTGFLPWLRADAGIRTAALICALEAADAVPDDVVRLPGMMQRRELVRRVQLRADEPGELTAYGLGLWGRNFPVWARRGIGDGVNALYDERAVLRYDKPGNAIQFADVIQLFGHKPRPPRPADPAATGWGRKMLDGVEGEALEHFLAQWEEKRQAEVNRREMQNVLFRYLTDKRKGRDAEIPAQLTVLKARAELNALEAAERHILGRRALEGDTEAGARVNLAIAGQWEWMKSWLGEKKGRAA